MSMDRKDRMAMFAAGSVLMTNPYKPPSSAAAEAFEYAEALEVEFQKRFPDKPKEGGSIAFSEIPPGAIPLSMDDVGHEKEGEVRRILLDDVTYAVLRHRIVVGPLSATVLSRTSYQLLLSMEQDGLISIEKGAGGYMSITDYGRAAYRAYLSRPLRGAR